VGDRTFDQNVRNGHAGRIADLARFAALGIARIRYPFLWERIAPGALAEADWKWADERIAEMKRLGMRPIAGLLHHGSGPRHTSLLDPDFPAKVAAYARAFAERYPEIEDYTPINEPLTTARFSALYGIWYPHARDDTSFVAALFHQIEAIRLAMSEIRRVNPRARLVQTEDLGRISGTKPLAYQVDFENDRRWLTFDLLSGRVTGAHPLYYFLTRNGLTPERLADLADRPCPPDIVGVNHYLLSNRFLDHRPALYPEPFHGGNEKHSYADVGGVETGAAEFIPPKEILREAWERYRIPVAVTEVHVNGSRETQLRWFHEVWTAARELVAEGADLRAVTAWSLLGSYDWNSLCTRDAGFYESGVFDGGGREPRPTALATMLRGLARTGEFRHPVLEEPGWWRTPARLRFGPGSSAEIPRTSGLPSARPILITGASGALGRAFARICAARRLPVRLASRADLDIADADAVARALEEIRPWAIVNAAGYVRVDEAEREVEVCFRENVTGALNLARRCDALGIHLLCFSSDLVFGGEKTTLYTESDAVAPGGVYGESKAELERRLDERYPNTLVVRTSAFFGPRDPHDFIARIRRSLRDEGRVLADADSRISPTYVPDLVNASLDLLIDEASGIFHLTGGGAYSWYEFARLAARRAGFRAENVIATEASRMGYHAKRPGFSALGSERHGGMPTVENALARYFADLTESTEERK
jgi:dTDP-4-dehydrorhamnose reductase